MTDLFGQEVAPASRLAPRASSVAATMSATYGLRSSTSSASAALQRSLANKLPALLDSRGSITFALTWKAQATPLRRLICALQARGHSTSDSGSTGWPTARSADGEKNVRTIEGSDREIARKGGLEGAVAGFMQAASWGTPDKILRGIEERRKTVGDFEMNVAFRFGGTPYEVCERGLKLFAKEVLPVLKSWGPVQSAKAA